MKPFLIQKNEGSMINTVLEDLRPTIVISWTCFSEEAEDQMAEGKCKK